MEWVNDTISDSNRQAEVGRFPYAVEYCPFAKKQNKKDNNDIITDWNSSWNFTTINQTQDPTFQQGFIKIWLIVIEISAVKVGHTHTHTHTHKHTITKIHIHTWLYWHMYTLTNAHTTT